MLLNYQYGHYANLNIGRDFELETCFSRKCFDFLILSDDSCQWHVIKIQ